MTLIEFLVACSSRAVDPAVALENEAVRKALKSRDDKKVRELLDKEF